MRSAPYDVVLSGAALALRPPRGAAVRSASAAATAVSASGAPPISYRNKTLYVFIIILSFQVLFPRLLRDAAEKGMSCLPAGSSGLLSGSGMQNLLLSLQDSIFIYIRCHHIVLSGSVSVFAPQKRRGGIRPACLP